MVQTLGVISEVQNATNNLSALQTAGIGAGIGALVGLTAGVLVTKAMSKRKKKSKSRSFRKRSSRNKKRKSKRIKHTSRGWSQDGKRRSKQKWEIAYQKRKKDHTKKTSKSRRGVHYTKKGQPYIILASGKARFIKKNRRKR